MRFIITKALFFLFLKYSHMFLELEKYVSNLLKEDKWKQVFRQHKRECSVKLRP